MLLPHAYQNFIDQRGQTLNSIGIKGVALARKDALYALEILTDSRIAILGGDVYRMEGQTVRPTRDSWYAERRTELESVSVYIRRTHDAARKFLQTYPDPAQSSVLAALGAHGVYLEGYTDLPRQDSPILFALVLTEVSLAGGSPLKR
jgi:hypothetical protein